MSKEQLLFCPLGGSGEIGGNMNLYAYGKEDDQKWIIVDIGVSFADDSVPGVDLIMPDAGFIIDKKDDLLGIVLTHAHEDHIGAVAHIWPSLKCKMYATPFTSALIFEKFKEKKIDISSYLEVVPLNSKIKLGSFEIDFVTLTHSILEPNGLSIKTPLGTVLHTGDWKIDPNPLIGGQIDKKKLKCVTKLKPNKKELAEIEFAFNICKYVKSNAIVICNNFSTIGVGAGQPSRLDSCKIAVQKAKQFQSSKIRNSIAASDAFFPFADGINALIRAGVKTIVQPGGSIRDQEVINAANKAKIKMIFTSIRHFNH